jgi:hypothetical protein
MPLKLLETPELDTSTTNSLSTPAVAYTVADLRAILARLPPDLEVMDDFGTSLTLTLKIDHLLPAPAPYLCIVGGMEPDF